MDHGFDDATWADNHHHLTQSIRDAIDKLSYAFRRLNALQYDAPWTRFRQSTPSPIDKIPACKKLPAQALGSTHPSSR